MYCTIACFCACMVLATSLTTAINIQTGLYTLAVSLHVGFHLGIQEVELRREGGGEGHALVENVAGIASAAIQIAVL